MDLELPISQGPEGDDEDFWGMNMIGEIPQGCKPEEAQHMPAKSEIVPRRTKFSQKSRDQVFNKRELFCNINLEL